jgi:4'-phosphopantetheinyl transferase
MTATRGRLIKSDGVRSDGGRLQRRPIASKIVERRSPNRPNFSEGWRKTIRRHASATRRGPSADHVDYIDIWVAHPDSLLRAHSCLQLLTDEDWTSLGLVQNPAIRHSAMAARILLRLGLSRTVDREIAPADWKFATTQGRRPIISEAFPGIHFSVSHVDELSAVAISRTLDVGIDVESVDQNVSDGVISGFSHSDEQEDVRALLPRQKAREFIRLWTFKEAYTKLIGLGHSVDFNAIKFVLDPVKLKSPGDVPKQKMPPQFESFYVSVRHGLYHVSLAIEHPERRCGSAEVQIISLAEQMGAGSTAHAQVCG